jgi:hypothetical protein
LPACSDGNLVRKYIHPSNKEYRLTVGEIFKLKYGKKTAS